MTEQNENQRNWWLGSAHLLSHGVAKGALKVQRAHLAIADESFDVLARIPVTRPVSEPVRILHHGISRFCYGGVAQAAAAVATISQRSLPSDKES